MGDNTQEKKGLESLGWGMWLVCFFLFYGPFHYMGWRISIEEQKGGLLPYIIGFFFAAALAGVLTTLANTILQNRIEKRHKAERKKSKNRK